MAFQNFIHNAKKFFGPENSFFHGQDRYEQPQPQPEQQPQPDIETQPLNNQPYEQQFMPPQNYQHPYAQQPQPDYQQQYAQPQQFAQQQYAQQQYAQPQPQPQQQVDQPLYQQGYQPQQTVKDTYVPPRHRRSAQHQQQPQPQPQQPQQVADQGVVVPFPSDAQQQPMNAPQQGAAVPPQKVPDTCVINIRSLTDCRRAIGVMRKGDCVIAVLDTIADQTELRRYVDTINGACFSLGYSITRLASRTGVYLLAPASIRVYTDQTVSQLNNAAPQQGKQRPAMQSPFQQAPQGYQQPQQQFYQQMQYQQPAQPQQYQQQQPSQGYAPDMSGNQYNAM